MRGRGKLWLARQGSHRVRGKDCVPLNLPSVCSMNSFLPELADTGRHERSSL